jgi:hypothetical protein
VATKGNAVAARIRAATHSARVAEVRTLGVNGLRRKMDTDYQELADRLRAAPIEPREAVIFPMCPSNDEDHDAERKT